MARRKHRIIDSDDEETTHDPRVQVLAAAVIAAADAHAIALNDARSLMEAVEEHIVQAIAARKAQHLVAIEAARRDWQREHGHLDGPALATLIGIDVRDLPTAERLGFVQQLESPPQLHRPDDYRSHQWSGLYPATTTLTDQQRQQLAETVLLSRAEAAERLAITPARFDRLRRQAGLEPNIAGTYRLYNIKALRSHIAAASSSTPPATAKLLVVWNNLNERQQAYLQAIYAIDQDQEADERGRFVRGEWSRPAKEWRQIDYGLLRLLPPVPTPLYTAIEQLGMRDEGTGSTFAALQNRKLITTQAPGLDTDFSVTLTTFGRRVVRAGIGEQPPPRPSKELLPDWAWKHLATLYAAGDTGIASERFGSRTRDYLRERKLIVQQNYLVTLSAIGQQHYEQHYWVYREIYPEIAAPQPQERTLHDDANG